MSFETGDIRKKLIDTLTEDKHLTRVFPFIGDLEKAKLSRAKLLMKNAKDNNVDLEQAIEAAVGIEIVHLATLIHDDVIDDSNMRRHEESFRVAKGDKSAVLYGDYLFSSAVHKIQRTQNQNCANVFVESIKSTCRGEAIQDLLLMSSEFTPTLQDLFDVARGKTGALFSFCTEAPAWISTGVSGQVKEALKEIGYLLGLAYQLADDVLDITGVEKNLGKPAGNDFQKNCITTPLFMMMQENEMDWVAFRGKYLAEDSDIKNDFLQSQSFDNIKSHIARIKNELEDKVAICREENWKIQFTVDYFWTLYVAKRMKLLKDFDL